MFRTRQTANRLRTNTRVVPRPLTLAARLALILAAQSFASAQAQTGVAAGVSAESAPANEAAEQPPQLPAIVARDRSPTTAHPGGQVSRGVRIGLLGDVRTMDTPFSVIGYTSQTIADKQASTVAEVIANDPSVRISVPSGGLLDAFYIRGFPMNEGNIGEFAFDGVYGVASNYRMLSDYVERVELIKGPTALLNGMAPNGGVGGSINIVPKRATGKDVTRAGLEYTGDSQAGARVDLGRRFGEGREFGVRVNGSVRDGDTTVDKQSRQAYVGALALDYQGRRGRATLDYVAQNEKLDAPSRPIFLKDAVAVPDTPSAPSGRRNVTQAWEWSEVDDQSFLLRGEYDVNDQMTAFADFGGGRTEVDRVFGNPTVGNSAGDATWTPARFRFDIERDTADLGLRTSFRTGVVDHALTLQASRYTDLLKRGSRNGTTVTSNIHSPADSARQDIAAPTSVDKVSETELSGVALSDTLSMLDKRLLLSIGVRTQRVETTNFNPATGAVAQAYDERATTPMVGVVVKPWQGVSVYGNYIQGLSKGDVTETGEALAPYKAKQYELGAKWERGALTTTAAIFQITKPSGQMVVGKYTALEQRNRGIELGAYGAVSPSVRLLGGVTLLDADLTRTGNTATEGKRPIGVPEVQANLGAEWDTPWWPGFTLTGNVAYVGKQYVDTTNLRSIPAWTRIDAGARWRTKVADKGTTFRLNVQNLFDRNYWAGVSSFGGIAQGSPRTLQLSAAVDF